MPTDGHQGSYILLKYTCTVRRDWISRVYITGDSQTCSNNNIELKGPLTNQSVNILSVENLHSKECTKRKSWSFPWKVLHLDLGAGLKKERQPLTFRQSWLQSTLTGGEKTHHLFFSFFFCFSFMTKRKGL